MRIAAFFVCILALPLAAQAAVDLNHLTVSGQGQTTVLANIADIELGLQTHKKSALEVQNTLGQALQPLLEKLKSLQTTKVETGAMQILPQYDKDKPEILIGYKGVIAVLFSTEASISGQIINEAINAGANTLNRVTLRAEEEKMKEARLKALELSCKNALDEANVVLKALKLENKGIVDVLVESEARPMPYARHYEFAAMAKSGASSLEVTDQELTVRASVQLQIKID